MNVNVTGFNNSLVPAHEHSKALELIGLSRGTNAAFGLTKTSRADRLLDVRYAPIATKFRVAAT